jgi:mannitol-1-phosphate 5-dehydrogenase
MNDTHTFVGFGFGPIQSGLFLYEAARSGAFSRFVVAEVVAETVAGLRRAGGRYSLNVATAHGVETHDVAGVEMLDPMAPVDRQTLVEAVAGAHELATALPSVEFFDRGAASVARVLAEGLALKVRRGGPACVVYAAENHNHAAEILRDKVQAHAGDLDLSRHVQFLNTVIGKMSQVLATPSEGGAVPLVPMTPDLPKTILVEAFNRILISRITLPGFQRGLTVLAEKDDLLPFEEAKLYGHNATHALLGYLAHERGLEYMSDAAGDASLMRLVRDAFLLESGGAMLARHRGVDALFTETGYRAYVEDLMIRMVNPYLRDRVDRIIRDPRRKLGWDDRLVGTMRRVLEAGIEPERYARGAKAALTLLMQETPGKNSRELLMDLWAKDGHAPANEAERMADRLME